MFRYELSVYVFWEGHKNWQNLHCQFVVRSDHQMDGEDFVAFLENMNFNWEDD